LYYHPTRIDLGAVLREVCHQHREIVPTANIVEHICASVEMLGDPKLLRQVFANLLSNAIKYSPDGVLVEVTAGADTDHIVVVVRDRGIGIPHGDIDRVFERYTRGSNVSDISGTGIGLHLAKMVVELHGGQITVESTEGEGAAFTVRLPSGTG